MPARQLDLSRDPIEAKRTAEKEATADKARSMTFKECAEAYMAAHEPSWKNAKHCEQWHSTLRRYLYPKFGGIAVALVTTEMVIEAIQPIWHSMPETASRVRGRIEVVIDWAKARGAFSGETRPAGADTSRTCCLSRQRSPRSNTTRQWPSITYPRLCLSCEVQQV